jgi:hypothetical protein
MAAHTQVLPAGQALSGHAALGVGGVAHFILRLFIWRWLWRFSMLIWHIKTFGPVILLLVVLVIALWLILRTRRRQGRREGSLGDRGRDGPGPRDR